MTSKTLYVSSLNSDEEYSETESNYEPINDYKTSVSEHKNTDEKKQVKDNYNDDDEYYDDEDGDNYEQDYGIEEKFDDIKDVKRSTQLEKKDNFRCGSCKKTFILEKTQKMIRCIHCGYRILYKLRTDNYITYKTE